MHLGFIDDAIKQTNQSFQCIKKRFKHQMSVQSKPSWGHCCVLYQSSRCDQGGELVSCFWWCLKSLNLTHQGSETRNIHIQTFSLWACIKMAIHSWFLAIISGPFQLPDLQCQRPGADAAGRCCAAHQLRGSDGAGRGAKIVAPWRAPRSLSRPGMERHLLESIISIIPIL